MNKSLSHLPEHKQAELELIKDIILEKLPDVRMIVLFGSYARGNWVHKDIQIEYGAVHEFRSDYDILIATETEKQAEDFNLHDRITKAIDATGIATPVSIIYHSLDEVNQMIMEGRYFFCDIRKEGIYLYKKGKSSLKKIKTLSPQERKELAQEYFPHWFEKATNFYRTFEFNLGEKMYREAAFMLHQATESFYAAITLVFINYRYRLHNIEILGEKAAKYDDEFAAAFPMDTQQQRDCFDLLKRAYVDARYKKEYKITKKQLEYLAERVKELQNLTQKICERKIESFT